MYQLRVLAALAATFVLYVPTKTRAEIACTPVLTFKEVRLSEPQNQLRKWTGVLKRRCNTLCDRLGPPPSRFWTHGGPTTKILLSCLPNHYFYSLSSVA